MAARLVAEEVAVRPKALVALAAREHGGGVQQPEPVTRAAPLAVAFRVFREVPRAAAIEAIDPFWFPASAAVSFKDEFMFRPPNQL